MLRRLSQYIEKWRNRAEEDLYEEMRKFLAIWEGIPCWERMVAEIFPSLKSQNYIYCTWQKDVLTQVLWYMGELCSCAKYKGRKADQYEM